MATLSIRLPDSLHRHLKDLAKKEKVSINQLVSTAVAEKIGASGRRALQTSPHERPVGDQAADDERHAGIFEPRV